MPRKKKKRVNRLWDEVAKAERAAILNALELHNNLPRAAIALGIEHTTLYKKAIKFGIIKKGDPPIGRRGSKPRRGGSPFDWGVRPDNEHSEHSGNASPPPAAAGPSWLIEAAKRR